MFFLATLPMYDPGLLASWYRRRYGSGGDKVVIQNLAQVIRPTAYGLLTNAKLSALFLPCSARPATLAGAKDERQLRRLPARQGQVRPRAAHLWPLLTPWYRVRVRSAPLEMGCGQRQQQDGTADCSGPGPGIRRVGSVAFNVQAERASGHISVCVLIRCASCY